MSLLRNRLATIEDELSLGHWRAAGRLLTGLLREFPSTDLASEHASLVNLVYQLPAKRRERLLGRLDSAIPGVGDMEYSAVPVALIEEKATTSDALAGLAEGEDGRISCWEVSQLGDRVGSHAEAIDAIDQQISLHRRAGDTLGAGEWSLAKLFYVEGDPVDDLVTETLAAWGSPRGTIHQFEDLASLIQDRAVFVESDLATALGATCLRLQDHRVPVPSLVPELAFKLKGALVTTLGIHAGRKKDLCPRAAAAVSTARASLKAAVDIFAAATPGTAKEASIELIKNSRAFQRVALVAERPLLIEIPLLVGVEFRRLCEEYQRRNAARILQRVPGVREPAAALLGRADNWSGSRLWYDVVRVVAQRVLELADEVVASTQAATLPRLRLASTLFKVDLAKRDRKLTMTGRLLNQGPGRAKDVELLDLGKDAWVSLRIV